MFYPENLELLYRRINIINSSELLTRNFSETLGIFNSGTKSISEFAIRLESFRDDLEVLDSFGTNLVFLPNNVIREKLEDKSLQDDLDNGKLFLAWVILPEDSEIKPGEVRQIVLHYVEHPISKDKVHFQNGISIFNPIFNIFKPIPYFFLIYFSDKETINMSVNFESGITHKGFSILLLDKNRSSKEYNPSELHYYPQEHHISFSISEQKRKKIGIDGVLIFYILQPELRQRI